jgi:hypothetical protein
VTRARKLPTQLLILLLAPSVAAQTPRPIQDNSFLIEEAYNQEPGVVQHISLFTRQRTGTWAYTFTQEWPLRGQRHQLSFSFPIVHQGSPSPTTGLGDVFLNYRMQLAGREGARVWVAPRLSAILPTGRWEKERGDGTLGVQFSLPASIELAPRLATHVNAGLTLHPSARNAAGARATLVNLNAGASTIFFLAPSFNVLVESIILNEAEVVSSGKTERSTVVLISPGVRWAFNFRNGLQVVPGIAYTFGVGNASNQRALVAYLSFEHRFKRE